VADTAGFAGLSMMWGSLFIDAEIRPGGRQSSYERRVQMWLNEVITLTAKRAFSNRMAQLTTNSQGLVKLII